MAIKKFKPTTPSRRFMTVSAFEEIDKVAPEKSLLEPVKKTAGRNSYGRITVRHRGGGVDALVDSYLVLLSAFAAGSYCLVDD